jgi:hypothetical protein
MLLFARVISTRFSVVLAVLLAAGSLGAAAAWGATQAYAPSPQRHQAPLIVYGQPS